MRMRTLTRIAFLTGILLVAGALARASGGGGNPPADPAITFVGISGSSTTLSVMNADGARKTAIFSTPGLLLSPCWSPSGTSICFGITLSGSSGLALIDVQVVNGAPVGSNFRMLVAGGTFTRSAWSPDGSTIAFSNNVWPGIWTVPAAGGTPVQIYSGASLVNWLAWKADGSQLAFSAGLSTQGEVRVLDLASMTDFNVCSFAGGINQIDWTRTGNKIVFDASAGTGKYIYTVDGTPGAAPQLVVPSGAWFPTWAPDDVRIAYTTGNQDNIVVRNLQTGSISSTGAKGRFANWRRF
jgi:Tol biopolymer transport system component